MLVHPLGAIRFGDQVASGLGVSVNSSPRRDLFIGVLLVSLATATTGPIAFVALAAPHHERAWDASAGWVSLPRRSWVRSWCSVPTSSVDSLFRAASFQVGVVTGVLVVST